MKTIGLVACAASKKSRKMPAQDLYDSDLFRKSRRFAENQCDGWFILSAMHGLVPPDMSLDPYELTPNNLGVRNRKDWAQQVLTELSPKVNRGDKVIFPAGQRYREFVVGPLMAADVQVEVPMEGLRICQQLQWLDSNRR